MKVSVQHTLAQAMVALLLGCAGTVMATSAQAQQTLARGVTMSDMSAVKQPEGNVTTLHATAVNNSGQAIPLLSVRFELYDAANKMVGEATASQANVAAGETWKIAVDTPVSFTRFTVMNVDAQP